MKKVICFSPFILLLFSAVFVFVCLLNSIIIYIRTIAILLSCIIFALFISKSKTIKKVSKIIVIVFLNVIVLLYSVFFVMFDLRELRIYNGEKASAEFENIRIERFSDIDTFNPFKEYNKNYEKIELYKYRFYSLWEDSSGVLILEYPEDVFQEEVKRINNSYVFYSNEVSENGAFSEVEIDDYVFMVLDINSCVSQSPSAEMFADFPNYVYIVGINQKSNEIVYVIFNNNSLGRITDYNEFIFIDCGWQYVEKSRSNPIFKFCYSD